VHANLQHLLILQNRDQKILTLTRDLEKIPRDEEHAKNTLQHDKTILEKSHEAVKICEVDIKKVDLEIATRRTTIQRLKHQQFETRKNDEFTALGNEVIRYEKEIDQLETNELELMEKADALRIIMKQAEVKLSQSKALVDEDLKVLVEKRKQLESRHGELKIERESLAASASEELLPLYGKLMKGKDGSAIVSVVGAQCTGCHMKLISSTLVKAQSKSEIAQCENCGRILYME
jgi:uncharacterized protein